jgi:hypothetical protein
VNSVIGRKTALESPIHPRAMAPTAMLVSSSRPLITWAISLGLGEHPVRLILDFSGSYSKIPAPLPAWAATRAVILRFVRKWPLGLLIRILVM